MPIDGVALTIVMGPPEEPPQAHKQETHQIGGEASVSAVPGVIHYAEAIVIMKLDDNQGRGA